MHGAGTDYVPISTERRASAGADRHSTGDLSPEVGHHRSSWQVRRSTNAIAILRLHRFVTGGAIEAALAVVAMEVVHPGLGGESVVAKPNSLALEPQTNVHKNARMTVLGRALLVRRVIEAGWTVASAADAAGCSERTGFKWPARYRAFGEAALHDLQQQPRLPGCLERYRRPPHHHAAIPAAHQLQGRALHPDSAPRMALRQRLCQVSRESRRHARLAALAKNTIDQTQH